jgi:hypothetical protein
VTKKVKTAIATGDDQLRVVIVGPMRGKPDWNYPLFREVKQAWLAQHPHDVVLNPAENFDGAMDREFSDYLQASLEMVLSAQMVVLLPGWEQSEGAGEYEVPVARVTSKIFYSAVPKGVAFGEHTGWDFVNIPAPPRAAPKPDVLHTRRGDVFLAPAGVDAFVPKPVSARESLLDEAKSLVCGDRNNSYGPPTQDFERSANALNAYGYRGPEGRQLKAHDIAILVMAVKLSRLMWSPAKRDSWVDLAGYAACGIECAIEEDK